MVLINNTSDKEPDLEMTGGVPMVYARESSSKEWHIHIDGDIGGPDQYRGLHPVLESAEEDDRVYVHITSQGGNIVSAIKVSGWLRLCKARTISVLEGVVCSAATIIALSTDDVAVMPHSYMMFHPASYNCGGEQANISRYVDFVDEYLMNVFEDYYEGFLTEEEILDMVETSKDIWMGEAEIMQRLKNRADIFKENGEKEGEVDD